MKPKPTQTKRRKPKFNADVWESDWTGKWSPVAKRRKLARAINRMVLHWIIDDRPQSLLSRTERLLKEHGI